MNNYRAGRQREAPHFLVPPQRAFLNLPKKSVSQGLKEGSHVAALRFQNYTLSSHESDSSGVVQPASV